MCIKNQIEPSLEITFFRPFPIMQHKMQHEKKETLISQGFFSAAGGTRTLTKTALNPIKSIFLNNIFDYL